MFFSLCFSGVQKGAQSWSQTSQMDHFLRLFIDFEMVLESFLGPNPEAGAKCWIELRLERELDSEGSGPPRKPHFSMIFRGYFSEPHFFTIFGDFRENSLEKWPKREPKVTPRAPQGAPPKEQIRALLRFGVQGGFRRSFW